MEQDLVPSASLDAVRVLTLNRPAALHGFTGAMGAQLLAALNAAADDAGVRVVPSTGAGWSFCAGQDLNDPQMAATDGYAEGVGAFQARRAPVFTDR